MHCYVAGDNTFLLSWSEGREWSTGVVVILFKTWTTKGHLSGSASLIACCQGWQPEFDAQDPYDRIVDKLLHIVLTAIQHALAYIQTNK